MKSVVNSTVLMMFSSRLLWLHQDVSRATSCLYADSPPSRIRRLCHLQTWGACGGAVIRVQTVEEKGELAVLWCSGVDGQRGGGVLSQCHTLLPVCQEVSAPQTERLESSMWRSSGTIVLNAKLKSTNRILAQDPRLCRCWRMKRRPTLTVSSTDLLAQHANCMGSIRRSLIDFYVGQDESFKNLHRHRGQSGGPVVAELCNPLLFGVRDYAGGFEAGRDCAEL